MKKPIELIVITGNPQTAKHCIESGVNRIMVDLEILGKRERQAHRDTLISAHTIEQVISVADQIGGSRMIVRTNPLHEDLELEIESVLACRPRFLMLPMVRKPADVVRYAEIVAGRSQIIPLVETKDGIRNIEKIASLDAVNEVYIGLNDLHLELGCRFLFEPLASGMIDSAITEIKKAGKPFGFGGIARLDEGTIPGSRILAEHVRLGSSTLILSRMFHRRMSDLGSLESDSTFAESISEFRTTEARLRKQDPSELDAHSITLARDIEIAALAQ